MGVKKKIVSVLLASSVLIGAGFLLANDSFKKVSGADIGPSAFEGPFIYEGETTVTYKYYSQDCNASTYKPTLNSREIDESKTVTITENQVLTYYLHTPVHYDSSKSYPIVSYMSGDGISIFCDTSISGTEVNIANFIEGSDYYSLHDKYRQNVAYGTTRINGWGVSIDTSGYYLSSYYKWEGGHKKALKLPHYTGATGNCDDRFVEEWAKLVYEQNRDDLDCFFLFLQPTDRMAFENKSNNKVFCIQNEVQDKGICAKYDSSVIKAHDWCNGSYITTTYIASELSIDPTEQLLCQLIDDLMEKYNIDQARQYVSGFSLGAMFAYDICCHYPNRFACCMTTGLPTLDLTEQNVNAWVNTNFWGFNGTGDLCDANCIYTKEFVNKVNFARNPSSDITARYSICSGGHSGNYIAGKCTVTDGYPVNVYTDTFDFMFNSIKPTECLTEGKNYKTAFEDIELGAIASKTLKDGKYDLLLVSGSPIADFTSKGFVITTSETKDHEYEKVKSVVVKGQVKQDKVTVGNEEVIIKATDYGSSYVYDYLIKDIPSSVTEFKFKAFGTSNAGTYYSKEMKAKITLNGTNISLEVTSL